MRNFPLGSGEAACNWPRCLVLDPHWPRSNRYAGGRPMSAASPPWAGSVALPSFRIIRDAYCLVTPGIDNSGQLEDSRGLNPGFSVVESDDVTILRVSEWCGRRCVGVCQVGLAGCGGIREMKSREPICLLSGPLATTIRARSLIGGPADPPPPSPSAPVGREIDSPVYITTIRSTVNSRAVGTPWTSQNFNF